MSTVINQVLNEAFALAAQATNQYLEANPNVYPCGFAWARLKPATSPWAKALVAMDRGRKSDVGSGIRIHNPSGNATQCMDAKEAGAKAFVDHLKKHDASINVWYETRID